MMLLNAFPFNLAIHDSTHVLMSALFMNNGVRKRPCISLIPQGLDNVKLVLVKGRGGGPGQFIRTWLDRVSVGVPVFLEG